MTRYDIINQFISGRGFISFLEIGTNHGDTYNRITAPIRVSVDPDMSTSATYRMTSDEFFQINKTTFDIVFIDGLHEHNQVFRDITNALQCLSANGVIVLHDCHPRNEQMQTHMMKAPENREWTGDVWKAFVKARATYPYRMYVLDYDYGCGIIDTSRLELRNKPDLPTDMETMTYADFLAHPEWMEFTKDWR